MLLDNPFNIYLIVSFVSGESNLSISLNIASKRIVDKIAKVNTACGDNCTAVKLSFASQKYPTYIVRKVLTIEIVNPKKPNSFNFSSDNLNTRNKKEKMIPIMKNPIHKVNSDIVLGYSTSSGIHCFIPTIMAVGSTIGINSGDNIRKIANTLLILFVSLLF